VKDVRLGWVLLGGFLAELAVFVLVVPVALLAGEASLVYAAPAASFVGTFTVGLWVARKAPRRPLLHGTLVGVVAMLLYLGFLAAQEVSLAYVVSEVLKVLGGVAGGFVAAGRWDAGRRA
jgi:hypothetical protein